LRRDALLRNAAVAASFSHPSFVPLVEIGESEDHDRLYLISDCVSGETLRSMLNARRYTPRRSIDLTIQLAEAVADAHAADLVHADLKPEEIIITSKGDARILHIGLAAGNAEDRERRADGYMAPERILGDGIDARTDVFSLGAILFEMLTGGPPPVAGPAVHDVADHPARNVPLSVTFGERLATDLRTTLTTALAANLDARCGSAAAFAAELRAVAAIMDLRARVSTSVPDA